MTLPKKLLAGVATSESGAVHPLHNKVHTGTPGSDDRGTDFDKDANEGLRCQVVRGK